MNVERNDNRILAIHLHYQSETESVKRWMVNGPSVTSSHIFGAVRNERRVSHPPSVSRTLHSFSRREFPTYAHSVPSFQSLTWVDGVYMSETNGVTEWEGQRAVGWGGSLHSPYNRPTSVSIVIYPSHSCSFLPHTPHARRVSLGSFLPSVTPPGAYGQEGTCEWWILLWFSSYIF